MANQRSRENRAPRETDCGTIGSAEFFGPWRRPMSTSVFWTETTIELPEVIEDGMSGRNEQRKPGTARGSPRRSRTAKASLISRLAVKSRCAHEGDGWGRIGDDGSGHYNPNPSEDPWGRATMVARTAVCDRIQPPDSDQTELGITKHTKDEGKPSGETSMPGAGLIRTSFREGLV